MKKYLMFLIVLLSIGKSLESGHKNDSCIICHNVRKNGKIYNNSFSENKNFKVEKNINIVIKVPAFNWGSQKEENQGKTLCTEMGGYAENLHVSSNGGSLNTHCIEKEGEYAKDVLQEVKDKLGGEDFQVANWDSVFKPN